MAVRPVDANALHTVISAWPESIMYKDWVQSAIATAPTLTPPTVGRCKDCDNWDEDLSAGRKRMNNYVCCCQEWSDFEDGRCRYTRPNDYCSYFEQREALKNGKTD